MNDERMAESSEQIFNEAAEIPDAVERAAFLSQACGDDVDLLAEVEALLRHHDDAGSFLENRPEELNATIDPTRLTGDDVQPVGTSEESWRDVLSPSDNPECLGTLGSYEVIELVGRGGMGVVLRAFDPKLNRTVAVKLLAPELALSATAVQRFLREARAAAAVSHDHVVAIHSIDDTARPPVIVMEFIDGQSLQQKIDSVGALDVRSILRIGMQTAAGLSAAHRQGLVHRDIKPSNILLENGIERVKLTDFGLARAVDDIGITKSGQITGTPQYMSPEQAQGQRVDHRTDLFSLGCVLYAMCTGRAPFRADSAVAVMHRVVHDTPRPVRELNEDIPDWLCAIVERLLSKNAEDRFDSAGKVGDLLGRHLAHLQQPDSVPMPERVDHGAGRQLARVTNAEAGSVSHETAKRLTFIRNVLGIFGLISLLWFFANLFIPYHGASGFGFTMPTLLFSLVTGVVAMNGAWHAMHRRSYGGTVLGNIALLFPVNIPQMLGLVFTIWSSTHLWKDDVRKAFASEREGPPSDKPVSESPPAAPGGNRHWLRRVPVPAWIALALFNMVFVGAIIEWAGGHAASSRGNGALFYLLGTGFVMAWGVCAMAARIIRGHDTAESTLPPTRTHIAAFFTAVILLLGVFVWQWAELSKESERQQMLGFFIGHGSITFHLPSPDVNVEFNGETIDVPADGVVVLRPDWPGSFVYRVLRTDGSETGGEFLIRGGMNVEVGSGMFSSATAVIVNGPIRGELSVHDDSNPFVQLDRTWAEQPPRQPVVSLDVTAAGHRVVSGHHAVNGRDSYVWVWPEGENGAARNGQRILSGANVTDVAFAPDDLTFAWVQDDGVLGRKQTSFTDDSVNNFESAEEPLHCLTWSPDGSQIIAAGAGTLYFWDTKTGGKPVAKLDFVPNGDIVNDIAFSNDGRYFATAAAGGRVFIWKKYETWVTEHHLSDDLAGVAALSVAFMTSGGRDKPDREQLCVGLENGFVKYFDVESGEHVGTSIQLRTPEPVRSIAISPSQTVQAFAGFDAQRFAPWFEGGPFRSLDSQIPVQNKDSHTAAVNAVVFTDDGRYLISGSEDGTIKWWEFREPFSPKAARRRFD